LSEVGSEISTTAPEFIEVTAILGAEVFPIGVAVTSLLERPHAALEIPASTTNVYSVPFVNPVTVALHELATHTEEVADAVPFVNAPVVFLFMR
jgi:hypothetical protein